MQRSHTIPGYRNLSGEHCGSTAMRNLLYHYCGLDLTEGEVLGIGAGISFVYIESEGIEPGVMLFGRAGTMEVDVGAALGVDYREERVLDDDEAWLLVREQVLQNRPTMLSGDSFHLDYRDFRHHFPAHRFVLVGFDDHAEVALVADRLDPTLQRCSYAALRKSRNPTDFISTYNSWGRFHGTEATRSRPDAYRSALKSAARRMLGKDETRLASQQSASNSGAKVATGLSAIRMLREQLQTWPEREDLSQIAGFAAGCIERYGTGGGNFRSLYAAFLESAHRLLPDVVDEAAAGLCMRSSSHWTTLSQYLHDLTQDAADARAATVSKCCAELDAIHGLEQQLFEAIDGRSD